MDKRVEKRVVRPTVQAARRFQRIHGHLPSREELGELKIQVASPFLRLLFIVLGAVCLYFSFLTFSAGEYGQTLLMAGLGTVLCVVGIRGRKKELESVMDSGDADGVADIIEAVMESLGNL
jgi:hypothetical protein